MKKITIRKNANGITLIALVITIIVLLILAGVSIAMLTGQNGILTQAQNAKTTNENKSAEEKVKLAIMAAKSQSETGELDADKLIAEITNNYRGTASKTNNGFPVKATIDGKNFSIDGDGNVTGGTTNQEGKVTIEKGDGTKAGDIIAITSTKGTIERFYVLSYDESTKKAKALAEWNLMVGGIYNATNKTGDVDTSATNYGLQNPEMKGYVSGQERKGTVAFSSDRYWSDTTKYPSQTSEHSSSYLWVYDNNSNLYQYVESYKTLLGNTDKVSEVSLASYEDINALRSNKSSYPWLCYTSYWLGSAGGASSDFVYFMSTDGTDAITGYGNSYTCGVRPVITVDMSKI